MRANMPRETKKQNKSSKIWRQQKLKEFLKQKKKCRKSRKNYNKKNNRYQQKSRKH